jgi:hypothetical protein
VGSAAQPTLPVAAAAAKEHPAPRQDAPEAKLAKAGKDAKVLPPHTKTDTDVAEKEPPSQKSAEALVRAALANVDAKDPGDAVIGPGITDTRSAPVDAQLRQANVPPRQADVGSRRVDVPPLTAAIKAPPHAAGADLRPPSPVQSTPVTSVDIEPRPVAAVDPLLPSASPPLERATPQADQDKQVRAGVLTCDVSGGIGLILGSQKLVSCAFAPEGPGRREHYEGSITKFGIDVGVTRGGFMVWAVFTNATAGPELLAGNYFGASGEVTMAAGLGANVLVGGSNRTVALQAISVSGQTGVNLAIGVAALHLGLPRQ